MYQLRTHGFSIREIPAKLGIGVGTVARTLQAVPKVQSRKVEWNGEGAHLVNG
jgi:hypothetical protein